MGNIATKTNNLLIRKKYLEKIEDMVLVGNTEEIFNESGQHSHEDIHLPAQAASVTHRIAFGPNTGQPVRRLKSQTSLLELPRQDRPFHINLKLTLDRTPKTVPA